MRLQHRNIVLGVTGGIAAYKSAETLRLLMQEGAEVRVVMTAAATQFITPLTFQSLSGFPVLTALYADELGMGGGNADESGVEHIELVKNADLMVVAPATANTLAKAAQGVADDALSTVLAAAGAKVLWAPAMNHRMWENPANRDNLRLLAERGHGVVGPEEGWMACREYGVGRMSEPAEIVQAVVDRVGREQDLAGVRVLVTAGRTEEDIDPVRTLTNRSSGRMGVAVVEECLARGAAVTLVAGPMDVEAPAGANTLRVRTALELADAAGEAFDEADALFMVAAVGDYRVKRPSETKRKRTEEDVTLELEPNPDVLAALASARRPGQVLVGFALETHDAVRFGTEKRVKKGVDLMVVNEASTALGSDTNTVTLVDEGEPRTLPSLPKREVARELVNWVVERRRRDLSEDARVRS